MGLESEPNSGPASGPKVNGSCVMTHFAWVLPSDPILLGIALDPRVMGHASEPKVNGSCIRTHFAWVLPSDPILFGTAS